jgi:NAD(P)-dependent dehydrogenase (short-subunit alcohol dehydrogenase family)
VLGQPGPLADAVIRRLRAAGADPIAVEAGDEFQAQGPARLRVRLGVADDIAALVREVGGARAIAGAVFLWGITDRDVEFATSAASCYQALVALAEGLETWERDPAVRIIVASTGAQSVLDEPVTRLDAAVSFGPVLVLPTEVQGLQMRSVDLNLRDATIDSEAVSRLLVEEAASPDKEAFVARRGGRRWVRRFERLKPCATDASSLPLKQGGVYLITGGLGGIGLKLAGWLAETVAARLLLTARRRLPPREDWQALLARPQASDWSVPVIRAIREIEAAGGAVITAAADVADPAAMSKAIDAVRLSWGPLNGVIHSAGVPGTGRLAFLKERTELHDVLSPKLDGLNVLIKLLGDTPLDFVALMSSINSVVGNPGACDYASANASLDSFVESALKPTTWHRVFAINWDAWRDIGMAANLPVSEAMRSQRAAFLHTAIDPAVGVSIFARILASRHSRVVVTTQDLNRAIEASRAGADDQREQLRSSAPSAFTSSSPSATSDAPVVPLREDRSRVFEAPATDIERSLAKIWTEVTGVADIGVHDDFFELGGHSLMATRVIARAGVALRVHLKLRDIFDAPTIRRLGELISVAIQAGAPEEADKMGDREEILL